LKGEAVLKEQCHLALPPRRRKKSAARNSEINLGDDKIRWLFQAGAGLFGRAARPVRLNRVTVIPTKIRDVRAS